MLVWIHSSSAAAARATFSLFLRGGNKNSGSNISKSAAGVVSPLFSIVDEFIFRQRASRVACIVQRDSEKRHLSCSSSYGQQHLRHLAGTITFKKLVYFKIEINI